VKNQDATILKALIKSDGSTAYSLSRVTRISVPQTTYRLNKLVNAKVVRAENNGKTRFFVHPALKDAMVLDHIAHQIKDISDTIDQIEYTTPNGMRAILELVMASVKFVEPGENDE